MTPWKVDQMPSQEGKIALITGGSSGIGYETALALTRKGARVIIASDNADKGIRAIKSIAEKNPEADIGYEALDLSDMESVRIFALRLRRSIPHLDMLVLNAGISGVTKRIETEDKLELNFATNYLGHFALTALLFPLLLKHPDSRIISVSSLEHRNGMIHFDDLQLKHDYEDRMAYAQSKLAMLLFGLELHRRLSREGFLLRSIPVHPGGAKTHIFDKGPKLARDFLKPENIFKRLSLKSFGQSARKGSIPILFAATSKQAQSGVYYGPSGLQEIWGESPAPAKVALQAQNLDAARMLWDVSEKLTGVSFDLREKGISQFH